MARAHSVVVLYRVPWDEEVGRLLDAAHTSGTRVLADVDDLVFEPEVSRYLRALEQLPADERRTYEDGITGLRRTLESVDGVLVSTEPLKRAAAALNPRTAVAFNTVSADMVRRGMRARRRRRPGEEVTIAYLSGTPTHDRDFLEAAHAVLWALDRYPHVRFRAVGPLRLDERFDAFGQRVERVPYQPWNRLPELLSRVDVNLAPLERENPFTECKSCLKYLEAAVVGIPTVASARSDFVRVIEDDVNGLLADSDDAWRNALGRAIESADLRTRLGESAYTDVRSRHTTEARCHATFEALSALAQLESESP